MHSSMLPALAAALLAGQASAFIRFGCGNNLVEERADPIINPGAIAGHAHKIVGGSGFGLTMDFAQARASKCSSCPIKEDMSNYWTPKLYFQAADGSFQSVPTVGDNMNDLNGGQTVYYLQRGKAAASKQLKAFPEGFRMLAGDSNKRAASNDFAGQAINYACLGAGKPETNGLPDYNCPGGLRAQVFFPSCWDGKNLDSPDHKSHMSYPAKGAYNSGECPSTHPVQVISLFYEVLYDTNQFKDKWTNGKQPFVFANGDATGYGFHGDFVNGWDVPVLQRVINECDDPAAQGSLEKCGAITTFTGAQQNACRLPSSFNEKVAGKLAALPGCNPVSRGPAPATTGTCTGQTDPAVGSGGSQYFTDVVSKGWAYAGCAKDGDPRTLKDKTTMYSNLGDKMTVEFCIDYCKGYAYAGLEYAGECYCGNNIAADRAPVDGILGNCNMPCKGDSTQICGGARAISLYKKCNGADCKNAGSPSTSPTTPKAAVSAGGAAPVASAVAPNASAAAPAASKAAGNSGSGSGGYIDTDYPASAAPASPSKIAAGVVKQGAVSAIAAAPSLAPIAAGAVPRPSAATAVVYSFLTVQKPAASAGAVPNVVCGRGYQK